MPIPKELEGIYNEEKYAQSQAYHRTLSKLGSVSSAFLFMLLFLSLYFGWFGMLDNWLSDQGVSGQLIPLVFFGVLFVLSDLIGTPFSLYRNFVIEEHYGFNKMNIKTYLGDKLKNYVLTLLFGGLLLGTLVYLVEYMGPDFWIVFWAVMVAFLLFANLFYTSLILPLFNTLSPLEEGELKEAIQAYSKKVHFPLTNIFVMDGSKRSSKGNAFFSGLGRRKKVVLFDTLIANHTVEELTAVFAHEVGHFKKKHIVQSTLFSILLTGLMLFLFSKVAFAPEVSWAMGSQKPALHLNLLAFGILYTPVSTLLSIIGNVLSRKNEFEADAYAKDTYDAKPLIAGLKKMSSDHLSNLTPHPAYVFVHYSHPPLKERVGALASLK